MFGLSIIQKRDDILLTASTGAAAANINSAIYYSAPIPHQIYLEITYVTESSDSLTDS